MFLHQNQHIQLLYYIIITRIALYQHLARAMQHTSFWVLEFFYMRKVIQKKFEHTRDMSFKCTLYYYIIHTRYSFQLLLPIINQLIIILLLLLLLSLLRIQSHKHSSRDGEKLYKFSTNLTGQPNQGWQNQEENFRATLSAFQKCKTNKQKQRKPTKRFECINSRITQLSSQVMLLLIIVIKA